MQTAERIEQFTRDGVEIIARDVAYAPHPNPRFGGKLVPFATVSKLLLADDTERYECKECGYTADTTRKVVAHQSGKHAERDFSYDETTIRTLLRTVKRFKAAKSRSWAQDAAIELNRLGLKTHRGHIFTATNVSSLFSKYESRFRVHVRTPRPVTEVPESDIDVPAARTALRGAQLENLAARITETTVQLKQLSTSLEAITASWCALKADIQEAIKTPPVDPQVVADASAYRDIQRLLKRDSTE